MSRNQLKLQLISIEEKIKAVEEKEMQACYESATGRPHEDMWVLFLQRDKLVEQKISIKQQLNKPTFIQIIRGR